MVHFKKFEGALYINSDVVFSGHRIHEATSL